MLCLFSFILPFCQSVTLSWYLSHCHDIMSKISCTFAHRLIIKSFITMYQFKVYDSDVLLSAISSYGLEAQLNQLTEECGELIAAVNHFRREREGSRLELKEEMADVLIMIEQIIIGLDCSTEVNNFMREKISRLHHRLLKQSTE